MKDSASVAAICSPVDCTFVDAAHRRVAALEAMETEPIPPPTICELEEALGLAIKSCQLMGQNWRNRIYRVELEDGRLVVAKQVAVGTAAMLEYQSSQLIELAELRIPQLRIPKMLGLLPGNRTYLMEFARGRTIEALVWNSTSDHDLLDACQIAGEILAALELARRDQLAPMPVKVLEQDMAAAPWGMSRRERKVLERTLQMLEGTTVAMGPLHYDYKPANLLFHGDELFLIDPPDEEVRGVLLWDFSLFRSSLRRHLWRFILRHPLDSRRNLIKKAATFFQRGYLARLGTEPAAFAIGAWFFELQRTAVLMTLQQGKASAARRTRKLMGQETARDAMANQVSLPLLHIEKRWLLSQLAHALR